MSQKTVMFIGLGSLGSEVLSLFLRDGRGHRVVAAGRDRENIRQRANLAKLAAIQLGYDPSVECVQLDLLNIEETADTIVRVRPDVIFSAVSLQSWWVITTLPRPVYEDLDRAEVGPWLPMHLTLVHRLMQAIHETGQTVTVVNAAFPDAVNPVLAKLGLEPTIGIGNVANTIPALRASIAFKLTAPLQSVSVRLFAQHYVSHRVSRFGDSGGAPFHLTAYVDGEDVTALLDHDRVFDLVPTRFKRASGLAGQLITATSAITVLDAIVNDTGALVHAPAPNGLPGGYAVYVDATGGRVALPEALTLDEAIQINEEGLRFDGIDDIDDDGTVHFVEPNMAVMREFLGYERQTMTPDESLDCAIELASRYTEFADRHGASAVRLPVAAA